MAIAVSTVMTICRICFQIGDLFCIRFRLVSSEERGVHAVRASRKAVNRSTLTVPRLQVQSYTPPHPTWHLLAFSIRKMGKNKHVNNRYSTPYKRKNIFRNFPLLFNQYLQLSRASLPVNDFSRRHKHYRLQITVFFIWYVRVPKIVQEISYYII